MKIVLTFNQSELEEFSGLIESSQIEELKRVVRLVISKDHPKEYIERKVLEALSDLSGFEIDKIKPSQDLRFDLGLTLYHKKSLKTYFQRVLKDLGSNGSIMVSECEKLKQVKDCITLVNSKI